MSNLVAESIVKGGLFFVNTISEKHVPFNENYLKRAFRWMRWNLLWFVFFCVIFIPLPIWLPAVSCLGGYLASVIVTLWQMLVLLACMINGTLTMVRLYRVKNRNWTKDDPKSEVG